MSHRFHALSSLILAWFIIVTQTAGAAADKSPAEQGARPDQPLAPPIAVDGDILVYNDGSDRRFFAAGMVDNRPASGRQLSRYDHAEMEEQIVTHARIGATAMRWNTFLKGSDLRWDDSGLVSGMADGAAANILDALDLAAQHGVLLQLTVTTGHFLSYGHGGENDENVARVNNNRTMFTDPAATSAYIDNVLTPLVNAIGPHPGLLGYLIVNEAHAMVDPEELSNGGWSDQHVPLGLMQRWANHVAGAIHDSQTDALVSLSSIAKLMPLWSDNALIDAGGHPRGTLDFHQVQFYPDNHLTEWSPFERRAADLVASFGGGSKPIICGEFPIRGMLDRANKRRTSPPFDLEEAYRRLWTNRISGGFTWSYNVYHGMDPAGRQSVDQAYRVSAAQRRAAP
jgi:hypothetical protein